MSLSNSNPTREVIRVIGPSIAYLPLTQGQYSLIDAEDAALLEQWNWFAQYKPDGRIYYAARFVPNKGQPHTKVSLHSFLLPREERLLVDHINRNPLDNRRCNLRLATREQNNWNRVKANSLGVSGVRRVPSGRFQARIGTPPNRRTLGTFDTIGQAHEAWLTASKALRGEFHPG